jgi:cobalt-zinc-cadmium resistance protein CzcA
VFGQDLNVLKKTPTRSARSCATSGPRATGACQRVLGLPLLEVKPDRQRLARYGMSADPRAGGGRGVRVGRYSGKIFEGSRRST